MPPDITFPFASLLGRVQACFPADQPVHLVGGALRDALLGRASQDLDFTLPAGGVRAARRVAGALGAHVYPLDDGRDTGRVILAGPGGERTTLDFAAYRGSSLQADLRARDFTINALAYDLHSGEIEDPLHGARDVRAATIRACSRESFQDDPLRVLRAVRLACGLGFAIEAGTRAAMKSAAPGLARISPERLRDELFRILEGPGVHSAFRALDVLGVLPHCLPELAPLRGVAQPPPHVHDVWEHTLACLQALEAILAALAPAQDPEATGDLLSGMLSLRLGRYRERFEAHLRHALAGERSSRGALFFAALYHDVAKPECAARDEDGRTRFFGHEGRGAELAAARARALHLSTVEVERLERIVRHHMRLHFHAGQLEREGRAPTRRAIYRFFRDAEQAGVDLVLLALADTRAVRGHTLTQETWGACLDVCRLFLEHYWEKPAEAVSPPRLVGGGEVMGALGLQPGPQVGRVLEAIREAQAAGQVASREQALEYGRAWLEAHP